VSKENKTKFAILGILSLAPMSGYDIKKVTDNSIAHFWNENFGHLYPVLGKLESEGLITGQTLSTSGRPDRSVYTLTDPGRQALADWLLRDPEEQPIRIELLLQVFFAKSVPLTVVIEKVKKEMVLHKHRLAVYDTIEQHLREGDAHPGQGDVPFWLMTLSFGKHRSRATVAWCRETIETLLRMQSAPGGRPPDEGPGGFTPHHDL
jgi:DNA-binding PadR family transcriptional regulator